MRPVQKDMYALRPLAVLLIVFAGLLTLNAGVMSHDDRFGIPTPQKTAEQFLRALKTHHYGGAREYLSESLAAQVTEHDLRLIVRDREVHQAGIDQAREKDSTIQGPAARAQVKVKLTNRQEENWHFDLVKEKNLWKLASLGPIFFDPDRSP